MKKKYDILVFIGRFQPFHSGHKVVVDRALELADKVLLLIGGANQPRSTRNPWTFEERQQMIKEAYPNETVCSLKKSRVICWPVNDHTYNDEGWLEEVQATIRDLAPNILPGKPWSDNQTGPKIGLIGCQKDGTSYYLKMFPQFGNENVEFLSPINATDIRKELFQSIDVDDEAEHFPWHVHDVADNILPLPIARRLLEGDRYFPEGVFEQIRKDYAAIQSYKKVWGRGSFLTADSLVECGGHILVVERGGEFGKGMLALPGGFVGGDETFKHAAIRELREETKLKIPEPVLYGSIVASEVFDSPHRSERGRIVTVCQHIKLQNELTLPKVKGSDDAKRAFWLPISEVDANDFFEDHKFIVKKMLRI